MGVKRMTSAELEDAKNRLIRIMIEHVGPNKKIGMGALYEDVFGQTYSHRINGTKALRRIITELRSTGMAICSEVSSTNGGYWLAASDSEIRAYCEKHKKRALGILSRIAKIRKISLPEYLGQMQLELEARDE
ncbi:hypothetical protein DSCW_18450 [Desulfosarcina widdelii]|uniref:Helix-turn-helix type 11 domain-containing protein n=1 Tax=Desulfosarcina widdelii TaxID=947919 RepID=A0A5K7Z0K1_9BACT|nr:hypothetical protein [Desulfosarcina widdelii]BBO74428.1 hypothetical protein DSCW_18450 [Desulfosarcina widdelii]